MADFVVAGTSNQPDQPTPHRSWGRPTFDRKYPGLTSSRRTMEDLLGAEDERMPGMIDGVRSVAWFLFWIAVGTAMWGGILYVGNRVYHRWM